MRSIFFLLQGPKKFWTVQANGAGGLEALSWSNDGGDNDFPDKFNWLVTLFSESRDRESNLEPRIPEFFSKGKSSGGVNTGQGQASLFHSENWNEPILQQPLDYEVCNLHSRDQKIG